jgi:hypothetical protein
MTPEEIAEDERRHNELLKKSASFKIPPSPPKATKFFMGKYYVTEREAKKIDEMNRKALAEEDPESDSAGRSAGESGEYDGIE